MAVALTNEIARIAAVDLFRRGKVGEVETGLFVARPFSLDYDRAHLLVADAWKQRARGIPQGTLLLAYYENEDGVAEALLLRALRPCKLPTDSDVIASMVEYYKDNLRTAGCKFGTFRRERSTSHRRSSPGGTWTRRKRRPRSAIPTLLTRRPSSRGTNFWPPGRTRCGCGTWKPPRRPPP
jgi:hypothetical protein